MSALTMTLDRSQEEKMLAAYTPQATIAILKQSAAYGGKEAAVAMKAEAPIGTSARMSQYYRRLGLPHGTFRGSVRAAPIRQRLSSIGVSQGGTVGVVIGPIGKNAFTRAWIELGTTHSRANPWVERVATAILSVAHSASDAVLSLYVRAH